MDNHLVAMDMATGKQLWNQKYAESERRYLFDWRLRLSPMAY